MAQVLKGDRYALMQIGEEHYAIPLDKIEELVDKPEYEPWAGEGEMVGYYKHNKTRIAIFDLSTLLNIDDDKNFLIIVRDKKTSFGLLVPDRPRLVDIREDSILPLPDLLPERGSKILTGVITFEKKIYGILNPNALFK